MDSNTRLVLVCRDKKYNTIHSIDTNPNMCVAKSRFHHFWYPDEASTYRPAFPCLDEKRIHQCEFFTREMIRNYSKSNE